MESNADSVMTRGDPLVDSAADLVGEVLEDAQLRGLEAPLEPEFDV